MSHRPPPEQPLPVATLKQALERVTQAAVGAHDETAVSPTIPLQIALHPVTHIPPECESLIVMVQYEDDDLAYADICDYSDGKFLDLNGDEIRAEVLAWGLAPTLSPEAVELLREWAAR